MIYAGCYTPALGTDSEMEKRGIEILEWNSDHMLHKRAVAESSNPSWLITNGRKQIVYAANEEGEGGVTGFVRTKEGLLTEQSSIRFPGRASCHLCLSPDENYLFVADYSSGDLTVLDCRGGKLNVVQRIEYSGKGSHPVRQAAPHIHSSWLLPSWAGQENSAYDELLVADLGTDRLYRYLIGGELPLTPHPVQPWIQLPAGSGPRHVAFHLKARAAYVTAELSNQVFLITFDAENMGHVQGAWQLTEEKDTESLASHLELWPEKKMLYAAVRGADKLVWFLADEDTGELTYRGSCGSGGAYPRHFKVDRERSCLLVANQHSGSLSILKINAEGDILPHPIQQLKIPNVVCVLEDT